jgi:hypothetical protein
MACRDLIQPDVDVRAVIEYDPIWPELFAALGRDLRPAPSRLLAGRCDPRGRIRCPQALARASPRNDRQAYVDANTLFVWATIARAHDWAQLTGWEPGPSDA